MKTSVSFCDFVDRFKSMGRESQFTYEGKKALFEWLEQYEEDTGEETELDIIALCCEFSEYANIEEFQADYGKEYGSIEDIQEKTIVIPINEVLDTKTLKYIKSEAFIIQAF